MSRNWIESPAGSARRRARLDLTTLDDRTLPSTSYLVTNLVSDQPGVAPVTDPTLMNAWGIALNPAGPFWISSQGQDLSEVYVGDVNGSPISTAFTVSIPGGEPTGQVFNGSNDFRVTSGTASGPARFIFASETGAITGWNPGVPPTTPPPSKVAHVGFQATDGAIYTGLALGKVGSANFLYAADFHNGKIDVLDGQFHKVTLGANGFGTFTDPNLQKGFAPFNVAAINGKLYVSYARQDADAEDEVTGPSLGLIDVFDTSGNFLQRLVTRGHLNAPWGMALAPAGFGDLGNKLLVGNFGDGRINAYDPNTGEFVATMRSSPGHPVEIDGLWGLAFGNPGANANTLYFTAGPDDETHGLFGKITASPLVKGRAVASSVAGDFVVATAPIQDAITTSTSNPSRQTQVRSAVQLVGDPDPAGVGLSSPADSTGNDGTGIGPSVAATVPADSSTWDDLFNGAFVG